MLDKTSEIQFEFQFQEIAVLLIYYHVSRIFLELFSF